MVIQSGNPVRDESPRIERKASMVAGTTIAWYSAKLVTIVLGWWFSSVLFALVMTQPFNSLLVAQSESALLSGYDPFVLCALLQRQPHLLTSALASSLCWLLASKCCAQVPYTLSLVALARPNLQGVHTLTRAWAALPRVTALSLLAEALPLIVFYLVLWRTRSWTSLLDVNPITLAIVAAALLASLASVLFCLLLLDFARVAVVNTHRCSSLLAAIYSGVEVVMRTPLRLFLTSALMRAVSLLSLTVAALGGAALANGQTPGAACFGWFVAQCGVIGSLCTRVAWLASVTERYNLRPPSRSN